MDLPISLSTVNRGFILLKVHSNIQNNKYFAVYDFQDPFFFLEIEADGYANRFSIR
ncbi:MAG: hypothetical protein ACJA04_001081 [Cellvibrionaceae bacterium]